ncbi:MAG: acyl-phosphate glycerol 3-phosphate acyltransferase [Bacteroidetes bacterium GWF2_38_335]|nr:MAG: acyl-phosphate glycerol 3-phosphate acyltransferase [Bacteroidetes bacterium GWF2_38_335]OFY78805.1 MAG: acyl-phosphate glycerol 3-phosphate acyltransferase [Bacteroidetes bacterium RIFOXYA12_FULL_38_20]HBS85202.1 acyl-phosphate glycerol 3-phosphate acyltransferase [Bacteroidales bacterium]
MLEYFSGQEGLFNIALVVLAYLMGSIPTSVWIGKIFYGIDVREHGSGNAGATNTLRVLGKIPGVVVLVVDAVKGLVAVKIAYFATYYVPETLNYSKLEILLAVAALCGHIFPVYVGFRGGKGVATMLGIGLAVHPYVTLIALGIFMANLFITGYVSMSSILAGLSFPIFTIFVFNSDSEPLIIFSLLIAVLLPLTHQKNILKLIKGEESKFSLKKKTSDVN